MDLSGFSFNLNCLLCIDDFVVRVVPETTVRTTGSDATFQCVTKKEKDYVVRWFFNDKSLPYNADFLNLRKIIIRDVGPQHAGKYKCTVTGKWRTYSSSGTLKVFSMHI